MTDTPEDDAVALPPSLVWLKWLVITLTLSLIGGVLTVVWLLVTRLPIPGAHPNLPPTLQMPAGATPAAVTIGSGWVALVTTDNRILIFGADGRFWQTVAITKPAP